MRLAIGTHVCFWADCGHRDNPFGFYEDDTYENAPLKLLDDLESRLQQEGGHQRDATGSARAD
jgi:hypothetical protein